MPDRPSARGSILNTDRILLVVASVVYLATAWWLFDYTVDDAYISLRYAHHLAEGLGLAWNPGEAAPVEGYSNFLWVLLMAGFERLVPGRADLAVKGVGLAAGWLCLPATVALARSFGAGVWGRGAALLLLAASPTFAMWSVSGLETAAFTLLLTTGIWLLRTRRIGFAPTLAVAALVRPEGAPLFAVAWAWQLGLDLARRGRAPALGDAFRDGAVFTALYLPFLVGRRLYYGSWVPNTVEAKFQAWAGLEYYLGDLALHFPLQLLAALAVVLVPALSPGRRGERLLLVALPATVALSLVHCRPTMGFYFRLFWPVLPLLFVATGLALDVARERWGSVAAAVLLGVLLVHRLVGLPTVEDTAAGQTAILAEAHRPLAEYVRDHHPPETRLAIGDCGLVPYVSGVRILDFWGLNDLEIARDGFDAARIVERAPELVALVSRSRETVEPAFPWEQALLAEPGFQEHYALLRRFDARERPYHLVLYERVRGR